jgi:hypothetical protein
MAIANLVGERAVWLKTTFRQKMIDRGSTCCAEGLLQRGPNQCVRLELQVLTDGEPSRLLIVSDGELLAQETNVSGHAPDRRCDKLPGEATASPGDQAAREAYLATHGCGGPLAVLRHLLGSLQNLKLHTGLLEGKEVVQIRGEVAGSPLPVQSCHVFLDAKTLWPHRVEWRSARRSAVQPVVQLEFLDPVLNQELSEEECTRLFSYQPEARATSAATP